MRPSVLACIVATSMLSALPARAEGEATGGLKLSAGTFQLGGVVGFTTVVDSTQGQTNAGFVFAFSPSGGYFVVDGLEVVVGLDLNIPFGDYYTKNWGVVLYPKRFGVDLGARYHFGLTSNVAAYAGLEFGFGYTWYENSALRNTGDFMMTVPVGGLVALNEYVAIDVGLRLNLYHSFDYDVWRFTVPIGYLGVQAYF